MTSDQENRMSELCRTHGEVDELEIDERFQDHQVEPERDYAKHHVSGTEVLEAHDNGGEFFDNAAPGHVAPLVMVGETNSGRIITVPIVPSGRRGLWRPYSAYEANAHDRRRYEERKNDG